MRPVSQTPTEAADYALLSAGYGALLASWGGGIFVGSLLYIAARRRSALGLILGSSAAIGLAYLGMATATSLGFACVMSVLGGIGNGIQWIAVMTALQDATPQDYQARIAGLLESLGAAMPGVGYVLGAAIVAVGSPRTAYTVAGVGVLVLVLVALLWRPQLEQRRPRAAEPVPS
jgi:MFS family permease